MNKEREELEESGVDDVSQLIPDEQIPTVTFDEYLDHSTGFRFGKLQMVSLAFIFLIKYTSLMIATNIGFIKMVPQFVCPQLTPNSAFDDGVTQNKKIYLTCSTTDYCNNITQPNSTASVDWSSNFTISNLITKFELYCTPKSRIMMFGASLKIGFLIYLIFFSQLLDKLGRKKTLVGGLFIHLIVLASLLFSPGGEGMIWVAYFLLLSFSVVYHVDYYAGLIYFLELMPKRYHSVTVIFANIGKACSLITGSIFFFFISKDYTNLIALNIIIVTIILIVITQQFGTWWFPESPKYHHMQGDYAQARKTLKGIAVKWSNVQPMHAYFPEEVNKESIVDQKASNARANFVKAFKEDPIFRTNFICIVICNVASSYIMDFFNYILPSLEGNVYINAFTVGSFQVAAYSLSGVLIQWLGPRKQIFLCYLFPFILATTHLIVTLYYNPPQQQNSEDASTSHIYDALMLGVIMFGFCINFSATTYAAYKCSPPSLAPTFFVLLNFFKISIESFTPIVAELTEQGEESNHLVMMFFAILALLCTCLSLQIKGL